MISDRWNGYEHLDPHQRQVCWSHIQRDFRRHRRARRAEDFGERGLELTRRVFCAWRAYQHDHHDQGQLKAEIAPIQTELRQLLETPHRRATHPLAPTIRQQPTQVWPALWTFVDRRRRRADQQPRRTRTPKSRHPPQTLPRHQQHRGERSAERAQSAATTCRLQNRSLFAYLRELLAAHNRSDPFPALT